ncbi:MAG: trimeric intracellular cation channel family protein [Rubrimonas sp.]|uniref:trimeric intracellular cation channel family protein n=1 Tax=Rubrimonas sp. TaxID=2036015 RepID=UPI002FDD56C1
MTPHAVAAFDLVAVFVFAISGALLAGRKGLDLFGMFVCAFFTGVGGGTIRDVLLDRTVFWLADGRYLAAAALATAAVFLAGERVERLNRPLGWADAAGLAVATPLGVAAARGVGAEWPILLAMGVITASFGGVIRDVLCREPPMALHREVYATAALGGAVVNVLVYALTEGRWAAALACAAATFAIRAAAMVRGWEAPRWRGFGK